MTTRAEHYGLRIGTGGMTPRESAEQFRRFSIAQADMRRDVGVYTTEDFYGERGSNSGWIWRECTGIESDPGSK